MPGQIIYLHGFLSAPASKKAQDLGKRMAERGVGEHFVCPALPPSPKEAVALVQGLLRPGTTVVGSSLGGFFATWLCENRPDLVRGAVAVNPAVIAFISLERYVGIQKNLYTGIEFEFTRQHIEELRSFDVPTLKRHSAYWLLAEEGDELLDYRQAVAKYAGCRQTVLPGGSHTFSRWNEYIDAVIDFAGF
jgi:predicted esterase YcpF (UPF0227 family)